MRPLGLAIAVAGLVAAGATVLSVRSGIIENDGGKPAETTAQNAEPEPPTEALPPRVLQPVPARVRPVAPETVSPPTVVQDTLERVEDREPLSPIGRAPAPSEGPPKATILHRPVVLGAGLFQAQGHTVALAGIEPTDAGEECVSEGAAWPCGVHARTAFRNWLRGRALTCVVSPTPADETVVSDCTLGQQDPAEWLVSYGWAKALPDGRYAEQEAEARDAGRGMFGPAPAQPAPMAITVPELPGADAPDPILVEPGPSGG